MQDVVREHCLGEEAQDFAVTVEGALRPVRDGDFRIRMADGSELRGSRRYRTVLSA
jgi:hypothetical protein